MPPTFTLRVSPGTRLTLPVKVGVLSLVVCDTTVGTAGGVTSMVSSVLVLSTLVLPTMSRTVAMTL